MKNSLNVLIIVLGILFVGLAIFYWITPANGLPSYFPGYNPASSGIHVKHGVAAFVVGLVLFALAWFRSGKRSGAGQ